MSCQDRHRHIIERVRDWEELQLMRATDCAPISYGGAHLSFSVCNTLFPNHIVASLPDKRNDEVSPGFDDLLLLPVLGN